MTLATVLSAEQFALYQSFMGMAPADIALELTGVHYRLDDETAEFVAYLAFGERHRWDEWQREYYDAQHARNEAVRARAQSDEELDLDAMDYTSPPVMPQMPNVTATVREAYRVACLARMSLRMSLEDLVMLVFGAFILDADVAYMVAERAIGEQQAGTTLRG